MIDFDDAPGGGSAKPTPSHKPYGAGNWVRGGFAGGDFMSAPIRPRTLAPGEVPLYLESLNPPQREAAEHTEGPLIVLAGAGSGKTKMLTSRIAHLMDVRGVPGNRILAVTFTNKAAREMKERVERHLHSSSASGGFLGAPEIGTFHSICVRILRREIAATPFTKPFVIYDDSDQLSLVKRVIEKLGIDEKAFSPKAMQAAINRLKCDAIEPSELDPSPHDLFERKLKVVYEEYQRDLFANNALDFGEILCMPYRIFRDHAEIRGRYQNRFLYIHVDEYQDTNRAQYLLLSQLASKAHGGHENICVVGDEDQSIYKWRGADIKNILDFEQEYTTAKVVKLEQNYRSTKTIITAASQVIKNNRERKDKTLWTANPEGPLIVHAALADEKAEAEFVVSELKRMATHEGRAYTDFAIFYRTHAQSRQFEEVFRREKVPYEIVGGLRFYDRKEIKDILSYFKVLQNPQDSVSLKRIINTPARGIGKTTIDKLEAIQLELERARRQSTASGPSTAMIDVVPPEEVAELGLGGGSLDSGAEDTSLWAALKIAAKDSSLTSAGTAKKLMGFYSFMERLFRERPTLLMSELYHLILDETGYVRSLREEGTEESLARIENLEEFDTVLQEFEEAQLEELSEVEIEAKKRDLLPIFLEESALATDTEGREKAVEIPSLQMMSLHSSKGLEYPVVFLVGMEEGLFPSSRATDSGDDEEIEEERRLCYVGITRAREFLFLTNASIRRIWGQVNYQEPARWFQEIPSELMEYRDLSFGSGATAFRQGSSKHFERKHWGSDWGNGGSAGYDASAPRSYAASMQNRDDFSQLTDQDRAKAAASAAAKNGGVYRIGSRMSHPEYGEGKIIAQEGTGTDEKVTVQFSRGGPRKFLLRFVEGFIT